MIRSIHAVDPVMDRNFLEAIPGALVEFEKSYLSHMVRLMEKYGKPILGVNLLPDENARTLVDVEGSPYKGVSFLTPERAVKALARMNAYRQWRENEKNLGVYRRLSRRSWYLRVISRRRILSVGVISPAASVKSRGRIAKRLIVS